MLYGWEYKGRYGSFQLWIKRVGGSCESYCPDTQTHTQGNRLPYLDHYSGR